MTHLWQKLLAIAALLMLSPIASAMTPQDLQEMEDLVIQIPQACPKRWEDLHVEVDFTPSNDIWQGDFGDMVRYIKFATTNLIDADNEFMISNFEDPMEVTLVCAGLRYRLFEILELDAELHADDTAVDSDGDGVMNAWDQCSNTPSGATVNIIGCAQGEAYDNPLEVFGDEDNDGIANVYDLCIGTTDTASIDASGCGPSQRDSDFDNLIDSIDPYPWQPSTFCPAN